ncbi:MAG: response regulator [Bacteroidales bacterium]|nr:response regulator [Bacteroidales bacterium]
MTALIQSLLFRGTSNETDILNNASIKKIKVFQLLAYLFLIISSIIGLIYNISEIAFINLPSFVLLVVLNLLFFRKKSSASARYLFLIVIIIVVLLNYFLIPAITTAMMALIMLFPVASVRLTSRQGVWLSLILLLIIISGSIIPVIPGFDPPGMLTLILFATGYLIMTSIIYFIEIYQQIRTNDLAEKIQYYESEIEKRDRFISKTSHKLRTSLNNITLINNLVHDNRMSNAQKELLDTLKSSTNDLIIDVNELVEIATPSIIDYKPIILSFKLSDTFKEIRNYLESEENNPEIHITGDDKIPYHIIGDPFMLRSILINLIKGITAFHLKEKVVNIKMAVESESENNLQLAFVLNFNIEQSKVLKDWTKNIRLKSNQIIPASLVNASKLLQAAGQDLNLDQKQGSDTIYFFLDFSIDHAKKSGSKKPGIRLKGKKTAKSLSESSILLVEDNIINQKIVLLSLSKLVKDIDVAINGKQALDMFGKKSYDAILMDIKMPVMNGITAIKKIRELEVTSESRTPIIAITANAITGDKDNCLAAGADDYVSKPFQVDELTSKISRLI